MCCRQLSFYTSMSSPCLTPLSYSLLFTGKSTVLCLLERFYDVAAGSVSIDGVDIRNIDPRWLHRNIVIVPQEPVLFSGTIFSNIAYVLILPLPGPACFMGGAVTCAMVPGGMLFEIILCIHSCSYIRIVLQLYNYFSFSPRIFLRCCALYASHRYSRTASDPHSQLPPASLEEVMRAGKQANAHDFIMTFPDGYNTIVGERGIRYVHIIPFDSSVDGMCDMRFYVESRELTGLEYPVVCSRRARRCIP